MNINKNVINEDLQLIYGLEEHCIFYICSAGSLEFLLFFHFCDVFHFHVSILS